jgi:phage terminase Nu1 subunit (DNA packaging protein)
MIAPELCAALDISRRTLQKWKREGLPCDTSGRAHEYDPETVRRWLIDQGLAEPEKPTAGTREDVAEYFSVHTRTVATWLAQGAPGPVRGRYDLEAISDWRDARRGERKPDPSLAGPMSPALEDFRRARAQIAELELARLRRTLIPQDEVRQTFGVIAACLRTLGESLETHHGPAARRLLEEALEDAERHLRQIDGHGAKPGQE